MSITLKNKLCISCGRSDQPHFSKRRCKRCAQKRYAKSETNKNPIAKLSDKRKVEQAEYLKIRLDFLNEHQMCQARLFGCKGYASEIHHMAGKIGKLLTDKSKFLAICRVCHQYLERNPTHAKELGFSRNRL